MTRRDGAEDEGLGRAFQAGDPDALGSLFQRFGGPIHDFSVRLVKDTSLAEDVTQSTFLRAIERRSTLRDPGRIKPWLFSIAYNLARDELKRRAGEQAEVPPELAADAPDPEHVAVQHDDVRLVWTAMASLEPRQQAALDLTIRHGLSTGELGGALGLSTAQASLVLFRARSALGTAIRSLLVAQSRTHCDQLAAMVPPGVAHLTPWQRRSVEHHMRYCAVCRERAAVLTAPTELLGGIALLPLPVGLGHGWLQRLHDHAVSAPGTVARVAARTALRRLALIGGGAALLLLGGSIGGVVIAHGSHSAPHLGRQSTPKTRASPSSSNAATPTPTESAAAHWADIQRAIQGTAGYEVDYETARQVSTASPGAPAAFALLVQSNGDYQGTYTATSPEIGKFGLRRLGGVLAVRDINPLSNPGVAGAPMYAVEFFGLTGTDVSALGDAWIPLTGPRQQAAVATIASAVAPYIPASQLASVGLAPPTGAPLTFAVGDEPSTVWLSADGWTLTYQAGTNGYVRLAAGNVNLLVDHLGGT